MNIFFMNSSRTESWGGSEKWMLETGLGLRERGHNVFFGGRENAQFIHKCSEAGFDTLPLAIGSDFSLLTINKIGYFLLAKKIDVALAELNKDIRLTGLASVLNRKVKFIARTGLPSIKSNFRYRLLYPRLLDGILVSTENIKQKYLSFPWMDEAIIQVIPNGIYPIAESFGEEEKVHEKLGIPAEAKVIGIFGKLNKKKQHTIFLEVAANIQEQFPDTAFLIVGDGPEKKRIQDYAYELGILDQVYMPGFQENLFPYYSACNLVLLTSQEEGIPHVVMEAMMMQKTVIAFDVGGVSELINSEKNGILIPPNDIYLMTQRVQQLLLDEATVSAIGLEARKLILEQFSMDKMIDEIEEYFEKMMQKNEV